MEPLTKDGIPLEVKHVLAMAQRASPEAIVAGGCLRDTELGKPYKDIDLFIHATDRHTLHTKADALCGILGGYMEPAGKEYEEVGQLAGVYNIWYTSRGIERAIQMVGVNIPTFNTKEILNTFDFGLCKIAFDGNTIHRSWDYIEGLLISTFICRELYSYRQFKGSRPTKTRDRAREFAYRHNMHAIIINQEGRHRHYNGEDVGARIGNMFNFGVLEQYVGQIGPAHIAPLPPPIPNF